MHLAPISSNHFRILFWKITLFCKFELSFTWTQNVAEPAIANENKGGHFQGGPGQTKICAIWGILEANLKKCSTLKFMTNISFVPSICFHRSIILIFIERKVCLSIFFPGKYIFPLFSIFISAGVLVSATNSRLWRREEFPSWPKMSGYSQKWVKEARNHSKHIKVYMSTSVFSLQMRRNRSFLNQWNKDQFSEPVKQRFFAPRSYDSLGFPANCCGLNTKTAYAKVRKKKWSPVSTQLNKLTGWVHANVHVLSASLDERARRYKPAHQKTIRLQLAPHGGQSRVKQTRSCHHPDWHPSRRYIHQG